MINDLTSNFVLIPESYTELTKYAPHYKQLTMAVNLVRIRRMNRAN